MSHIIIHISDLHVTAFRFNDGRPNTKINSYLTTNTDEAASDHYVRQFIKQIKTDYQGFKYWLLISGDISDRGEKPEFSYAEKFIDTVTKELSISPENILILPGDHDVHRRSLENAVAETPNTNSHLLNDIKFTNFAELYKVVKMKDFPFHKLIIDHVIIEDSIVLIGINSNYKINAGGGEGFLPIDKLRTELEELKTILGRDNFQLVACWHHNITAGYEDTNSGQWENENRQHLLAELERQNIKLILTGNEHTSHAKSIQTGSIWMSDAGAFAATKSSATFKIYSVNIEDTEISLSNIAYSLQTPQGNDQAYFWNKIDNAAAKQPSKFLLHEVNTQVINEVTDLPHPAAPVEDFTAQTEAANRSMERIYYENPTISDRLYAIIKEKQLFHSGHFHWSETSRAHNWIDVSKLLEEHETLYFVQNAIIDIFEKYDIAHNCSLIIGLGYEGNIIASKAAIRYNLPYTSLPYSYRYEDHHDYENKLNYTNADGDYKCVVIITDVVNDGRTIRKLIDDREKEFFNNVEKIIVLSLFYTGHQEIDKNILNYDKLPPDYDLQSDYKVNNIEYYTVKSLRVEKCPYGDNYRQECFIYKDGLSCVHTFYAE